MCNDSINQITRDMPPPTPADLQGFWEMVLLQVDNVDSLYADLDKIRANGWKVRRPVNTQTSFIIKSSFPFYPFYYYLLNILMQCK